MKVVAGAPRPCCSGAKYHARAGRIAVYNRVAKLVRAEVGGKTVIMYIGVGTIIVILLIVILVMALRGRGGRI